MTPLLLLTMQAPDSTTQAADSTTQAVGTEPSGPSVLLNWLDRYPFLESVLGVILLLVVAWAVYAVTRRLILRTIRRVAERTKVTWDDQIIQQRVFDRLAHVSPALVVYYGIGLVPSLAGPVVLLGQRVSLSLIIVVALLSISNFLTAVNEIYQAEYSEAKSRPIKGYLQILKIFLFVMGGIVVIATLMNQSPVIFISGLGALTAVIMLIFRDTILSLVASIQLATNDMIRIGDWVEMPKYNADGDVIDVALHSVKIQNWDMTVTTVPTYEFIQGSFKNWRHMSTSGGRRIKRSLSIDLNTVRFLTEEEISNLTRFELLGGYLKDKQEDLRRHNEQAPPDPDALRDRRSLTNLGTFRAYVLQYLRNHPMIHKDMTLMVRQLAPGPEGLPLELYCFSNDTAWVNYEGLLSDIFDHLIATLPEFGLRAYQHPAGSDFQALSRGIGGAA